MTSRQVRQAGDDDDDDAAMDDSDDSLDAATPRWVSRDDDALADDERDAKFAVTSFPVPLLRRKEKTWLPCEYCGKQFDRPSLLKRHMRTHTGQLLQRCQHRHWRKSIVK